MRSIILGLLFLLTLLWSSLVYEGLFAASEQRIPDNGTNHALIIGIGNYDQWPKLKSPSNDAKEIARILTEKYDFNSSNVTLLTDDSQEKPTLVNIVTYLDRYKNSLAEKDNLLIFYSGHSSEDEGGDTYWIPKDANEKLKVTWLNHADICDEYLGSEDFKAKSVAIITDSLFSKNLLRPSSISLSPYDLRYGEKIREKALKNSREVIAFGDKHWAGSDKTGGFGLFTYYLRKSLMDNWFKVIDLENLIFNEEFVLQARKVAGTRLIRGRLRMSPMEQRGQTIISRTISPPPINITTAYVNPKKGYAGDKFIVEAVTNRPAFEVYVEVNGRKYLMDGDGTQWRHSLQVASIGTSTFKVMAINEDDIEGKSGKGNIETIMPLTGTIEVATTSVSPELGEGGDEFTFTAKTESAADGVALIISGERFKMNGSGTEWSLKKKVEESGQVAFSIVALNDKGIEGRPKGGVISVKAPKINIVSVNASPARGYAGDEFSIYANTDFPARSVMLELDGVTYEMEGSDKKWQIKRKIPDIGKKQFTVIAKNTEGITGISKSGEILTSERPAGIPDITTVLLSPEKVRAGEDFVINVRTAAAAKEVFVELQGEKVPMQGSGTEWKYLTKIASVGTTRYRVSATNKDGATGRPKEGNIVTTEKIGIDVVSVDVSPKQGDLGQTFTFKATTAEAAKSVAAVIKGQKFKMTGSGTNWSLAKKIEDLGTIDYYIIASDSKGVEGGSKGGSIVTKALFANVVKASAKSANGYAGEEFTISVNTDNPASSVSLDLDGVTYDMEGSGTTWQYKRTIHDTGKKKFTVTAKNIEGAEGTSKTGELFASLAIANVKEVSLNTDKLFAGEDFLITAKTSAVAEKVFIEIDGKKYPMGGAGTEWSYPTQITKIGTSKYRIIAQNKEEKRALQNREI